MKVWRGENRGERRDERGESKNVCKLRGGDIEKREERREKREERGV